MTRGRVSGEWKQSFNEMGIAVRRKVALKLYDKVRALRATGEFPYDVDQKRSQDKRKIYGYPWHVWSMGAAFVGSEKIVGRYYKGEIPKDNRQMISIRFDNIKKEKWGLRHYGSDVIEERGVFSTYPTESEIVGAVEEALNEYRG